MPMRSATDWAIEMTPDLNYVQLLPLIIAIQRDALESAAKMCEEYHEVARADSRRWMRYGIRETAQAASNLANAYEDAADGIRALIPTDGSEKAIP